MAFIDAIFNTTYHTRQLNFWPNSSASHVVNYSWLTACQGDTHMEIFGCNNVVSHKAATRLKMPWICNVFYLVATLLNGCKHFVFMWRFYGFYTPEVADTHIWVFQCVNPIGKDFIKDLPHKYTHLVNWNNIAWCFILCLYKG